jgi:hypothetical protein
MLGRGQPVGRSAWASPSPTKPPPGPVAGTTGPGVDHQPLVAQVEITRLRTRAGERRRRGEQDVQHQVGYGGNQRCLDHVRQDVTEQDRRRAEPDHPRHGVSARYDLGAAATQSIKVRWPIESRKPRPAGAPPGEAGVSAGSGVVAERDGNVPARSPGSRSCASGRDGTPGPQPAQAGAIERATRIVGDPVFLSASPPPLRSWPAP